VKAILDGDIIVAKSPAGVEIGPIPSGVDLTRLRYDAYIPGVVDLMDLTTIYVEHRGGGFILHAIPSHPDTGKVYTPIVMSYTDRKNLIQEDDGSIRLMTAQEIADRDQAVLDDMADNRSLRSQARDLVSNLTYQDVLNHIDNVFGGLSTDQKTSLKKLYCAVLYLAKKAVK
jgi:hypothetical protein